jgi:hypothetical protein
MLREIFMTRNPAAHLPKLPRADKTQGDLAAQITGVRLPINIDAVVRSLPNRTAWLRRVITEAAQRELIEGEK